MLNAVKGRIGVWRTEDFNRGESQMESAVWLSMRVIAHAPLWVQVWDNANREVRSAVNEQWYS